MQLQSPTHGSFAQLELQECVYENGRKHLKHDHLIEAVLHSIEASDKNPETVEKILDTIIDDRHFRRISITHKHEDYIEEKEYRLSYIKPSQKVERKCEDNFNAQFLKTEFRQKKNFLLPYVALTGILPFIEEIMIGPGPDQDRAHKGISDLLESKIKEHPTLESIKIIKSKTPYRI